MIEILVWEMRQKQNISLRELEKMILISRSTLNNIENSKVSPTLEQLYKISKALNCKIEDLYILHENS